MESTYLVKFFKKLQDNILNNDKILICLNDIAENHLKTQVLAKNQN